MVPTRAVVVAEVPDVGGRVFVRGAATHAVLRVGRVLERRPRNARIVEAEGHAPWMRLADGRQLRVVGVVDELGLFRQRSDRLPPALCHELELAVTVELVAKEIAETDRTRSQTPHELRQRTLVDLEQPELSVPGREQGR